MHVWLVTIGEPLPIDRGNDRLLRTGLLAGLLAAKGHHATWWTSTFDHIRKTHRVRSDGSVSVNERLTIRLLHSVGYRKNVSAARVVDHWGLARKFAKLSRAEAKPDIVLCSLPPLELSLVATRYGKERAVPVVLDIRDLWPDTFLELFPGWGRGLARAGLIPMFAAVRSACAGATAITGVTPAFVRWGLTYANRAPTPLDQDFPPGYQAVQPAQNELEAARERWREYSVDPQQFNICFFGAISRQFELDTVLEAARKLDGPRSSFRFFLCGDGDRLEYYRQKARDCKNVVFPGWVNRAEIWSLMRMSSVGLAPYLSSSSFAMSIPNKPVEYLSAGLPIVSSLQGVLKELLATHGCGLTYANGNSEELSALLRQLHSTPAALQTMSENASKVYEAKFVAEKVYSRMTDYLESVNLEARRKISSLGREQLITPAAGA